MNIVHVVRQFHPAVGGLESVVRDLASAQLAAGHRVRIVTLNRLFTAMQNGVLPSRDELDGVEVVRIPFFGSRRYPLAPTAIKFTRDADIVHVHAIDFFFDYLAWSKPLHRKKLVVSTHGGFFHTAYAASLKRWYFLTITRMSLTWYDAVIAVSIADQQLFGRIRKRRIVCIENGVNVRKYVDAASAVPVKAVLALGRFASHKRLDRLMSFVAALRRRDPEWNLTIAGSPSDMDVHDLAVHAEAQNVRDAMQIVLAPTDETIRKLMGSCSVIASASEYEGFGVVPLEGMSAGLFPLLSDIPTFRRLVIHTGCGMLVDFSDAEMAADEFSDKWREIAADYLGYRKRSIDAASKYDWKLVSRTYAELYEDVCTARTQRKGESHSRCGDFPQYGFADGGDAPSSVGIARNSAWTNRMSKSPISVGGNAENGNAALPTRRMSLPPPVGELRPPHQEFLGLTFCLLPQQQVLQLILEACGAPYRYVTVPNANHVVTVHGEPGRLLPIARSAWLSVCDSRILRALARLEGISLPLVTGADLVAALLSTLNDRDPARGSRKLLIVGPPHTVAATLRTRYPNVAFEILPAPAGLARDAEARLLVARDCVERSWDILLLCVGCPAQELIARQIAELRRTAGVALCAGGAIDYLTGAQVRAPVWLQKLNLEWAYRVARDPRRLWRKQLIESPKVLRIFMKMRTREHSSRRYQQ